MNWKSVSDRRHLPVHILDLGLRVAHRIQAFRCAMDDLQHATLFGQERLVGTGWGTSIISTAMKTVTQNIFGGEMKTDYANDWS